MGLIQWREIIISGLKNTWTVDERIGIKNNARNESMGKIKWNRSGNNRIIIDWTIDQIHSENMNKIGIRLEKKYPDEH